MTKKTNNKPSNHAAIPGTPGGGNKKGNAGLIMGAILAVIFALFSIFMIFSGGGAKEKKTEKAKEVIATSETASSGKKQAKVYDTPPREIKPTEGKFSEAENQQMPVNTSELTYYTEPVTNVQMVMTPAGPFPVASPEGQKYIADFKAYQSANGSPSPNNSVGPVMESTALKQELHELRDGTNGQVQALDLKINALSDQVAGLVALTEKQNETIVKLSQQIKVIQPITKSSGELAKEFFGKGGEITLKERNRSIAVDSIVGDKAYFTTKDGKTVLLGIGDIVPGTSVRIKKVDASTNSVLVAE